MSFLGVWLKSFGSEISLSSAPDNGLSLSQMLGKNMGCFDSLSLSGKNKTDVDCVRFNFAWLCIE